MNKDSIRINTIEKDFIKKTYVAKETQEILVGVKVNFNYKSISDAKLYISTDRPLTEEEIKDKIIEVINS